jgi:hypothetical protein
MSQVLELTITITIFSCGLLVAGFALHLAWYIWYDVYTDIRNAISFNKRGLK